MKIPVFHDAQHGTAILIGAAVVDALHVTGETRSRPKGIPMLFAAVAEDQPPARAAISWAVRARLQIFTSSTTPSK